MCTFIFKFYCFLHYCLQVIWNTFLRYLNDENTLSHPQVYLEVKIKLEPKITIDQSISFSLRTDNSDIELLFMFFSFIYSIHIYINIKNRDGIYIWFILYLSCSLFIFSWYIVALKRRLGHFCPVRILWIISMPLVMSVA